MHLALLDNPHDGIVLEARMHTLSHIHPYEVTYNLRPIDMTAISFLINTSTPQW